MVAFFPKPRACVRRVLVAVTLLLATWQAQASDRPNIVLVLLDDLGYADVGFNGAKDIDTPQIDALAHSGVTFSSAYVAHPFCGPSRAALMTGRYPHKFGSQFNLPHEGSNLGIPLEEVFISNTLQRAGYYTGAIGKWHLGEGAPYHPNRRGFDDFYGFLGGGHDYHPEKFNQQYKALRQQGVQHVDLYLTPLEFNGQEVEVTDYLTDDLSNQAVAFVERASQKDQPFFLYLAYNAPHVPLQPKASDYALFKHIKDEKRRQYAAMVYSVDRGVGQLTQALARTGELDNTLIIFMSDNGGKLQFGANNAPLQAGKGSVQEGGIRVPMFAHWPRQLPRGKVYSHPVSALDLYPTFAQLAGLDVAAMPHLDGRVMFPAVQKNRAVREDASIYAMRHRYGYSETSVRRNNMKAVNVQSGWQLFDVEADPGETRDVSHQYPLLLRDLVNEGEAWAWEHTQPSWFHVHSEGVLWREKAMPRFHETFSLKDEKGH